MTSSSISLALLLRFGALRPAGDQAAEQHGERAQVDDDAGDHVCDLGREIACGQERTADRDVRDEQRGEDGADRVGGRQQRRGDAVEAHGGQRCGVEGVPLGAAGQIQQPRAEPGQRPGDGHGEDDVLLLAASLLRPTALSS